MPINIFSAEQAMANLRARRSSLWPERWRGEVWLVWRWNPLRLARWFHASLTR